jgi:hypothetical protein
VQRLVPATIRMKYNDVAGFIYAVLGVIYAVLLALVVIAVWEEYGRARVTVESEANALAETFWLAHQFPEPQQHHIIQELARSYARVVVEEEWPLMADGRSSPRAWALLDEMRAALQGLSPGRRPGRYSTRKGCIKSTTWPTRGGRPPSDEHSTSTQARAPAIL